jgi:hypothetical protein
MTKNEHDTTATLRGTNSSYATTAITDADGSFGSYYIDLSPNF